MKKPVSIQDEAQLRGFGYTQELLRTLGGFSNFAISFSVISILTGSITLYGYGLATAGPRGIILGWILVSLASIPIALSMAELASAFPTAGALYHWASFLGNKHVGWFTAWFNYLGQFAITAGIDYGLAEFLVALFGGDPNDMTKFWVYGGVLLSHALINHYGIRLVAICNDVSAWYHVGGTAVLIGALFFFAPLQSASFLMERSTTLPYPYLYTFCLGLLQAQWTISGYDASAHVSEETLRVSRRVPIGIITAVVSSGVLGLFMLIVITLAIGDLSAAQKATNPFIYIMQSALGAGLGSVMVWLCVIAMWFCGLSSLTSNSRMLFAFARDGGVPFHRFLCQVSPTHRTPAAAIWLSATLAFFLALWGGAYTVVVGISTVLIFISYGIPILLAWKAQKDGRFSQTQKGEFSLGKWSQWCNGLACFWIAFIIYIFIMPPNTSIFYATAVLTFCLGLLYWVVGRQYRGVVAHPVPT